MERIEIHYNKKKLIGVVLYYLAMFGLLIYFVWSKIVHQYGFFDYFVIALCVFVAAAMLIGILKAVAIIRQNKIAFSIDEQGIVYSDFSPAIIPWADIHYQAADYPYTDGAIEVCISNGMQHTERLNPLDRWFVRTKMSKDGTMRLLLSSRRIDSTAPKLHDKFSAAYYLYKHK